MTTSTAMTAAASSRPVVAATGAGAILLAVWGAAAPRPVRSLFLVDTGNRATTPPPVDEQIQRGVELELPRFTSSDASTGDTVAALLGWGTVLALALVAVGATLLALRAALAAWRDRQRAPDADEVAAPDLDAVAVAVTADAEGRLGALAAGSPAEGIIMAWSRLESSLADAGVPLTASRTSTEVTLDTLHRFRVEQEAIAELATLYREARFSRHDLGEADRERAEACYRALDADLRAALAGPAGARRG